MRQSFKGDANLKERIGEKILRIKRNQNGNEDTDNISDKNRQYGKEVHITHKKK